MNLLKRVLTSIETVQAAILAILNLLAVFGTLNLTDVQLGALNLAILAIARALSEVVYGQKLDDLANVVNERADQAVRLAKFDMAARLPSEVGAVDRSLIDDLLR